ncbi:hypothetical protein [Limnoglobus roseus]|uniref:HEAT repeat domain-containing protein n=1 Tax=Limnoglobus roseus TaxID=2598579 RepID=A0A5C1ABM9_9BACT|nr:hypothetical protein [Limnoglobus roseus]QEL15995.1 HEAT repeat domain-containing protein [Limnoglobus roseus]
MFTWPTILVFAAVISGGPITVAKVQMSPLAVPSLRTRPPLTADQKTHILKLIARLAEVDRPDVGYSQTLSGSAFLPVPGQVHELAWTLTHHGLDTSQSLRDLVALGPDSLPFLLDSLGDKTPTKLTFEHGGADASPIGMGCTWLSDELPRGNDLNPREARVPATLECRGKHGDHVQTYVVKVGDLCLVAIGQIVGRPYMAARYQMTSCTVINSPVEDADLRGRVRKIWASGDPTQTLYDSLWTDYRTTGVPQGPDLTGWNYGSRFQRSAALRLLYYFPEEAAPVLVARLAKLDVTKAEEGKVAFNRQGVANGGIYADELIPAVSWCKRPEVREAVRGIFRRTTEAHYFSKAVAAFDEAERDVIVKKADELLAVLTLDERKDGVQYLLLEVASDRAGSASAPLFRGQIGKSDPVSLGSMAGVLGRAKGDWPVELLRPLLDDQRQTDRVYYVRTKNWKPPVPTPLRIGGQDDGYEKVPVRVCDAAAEAMGEILPATAGKFPDEPDRTTVDQYVSRLKQKLPSK